MKQKTGRKLLGVLLALALTVGLLPGMGLTAYAAGGVTIGNGSYPYGKNMTSSITFIVDVAASSGGVYQWYVSDSSNGNYSEVAGASGSFEANADSFETTFTPTDGKWYKCRINNEPQYETQPVMAKTANGRWYISNGTMAYSFFESNTRFDVIGQINGTWVTQTSYDTYWNFYTSTEATPAPLKVEGTGPSSSATLKSAKAHFSTSNPHVVNFEATIGENEHAFAFGCDVKIRYNDNAPTTAIIASRTGSVKQMQLVDTKNLATAADTDPAMVVKYTTIPTHFWIGMWVPRYYYATNVKNTSTCYEDNHCSWNDAGVCYQYQGDDSGMTVSWTNRNGGDTIGFSFALGSVAETGAVTGKIDYSGEQIESLKANTTYVITVLDQDGNPTSETYTITSDSNGYIPLAGTDDNNKAYDLIGKLIQIGVEGSLSDPMEMDIAPRPDTEDPSQSGEGIYEKPEDVKENEVFVTENSITIKPQTDIGKRQQYRLYNSVGEEIAGQNWQSLGSDGTITFTGLSPNTSYLVKAFIPATQTAPKSLPSQGATISTFGTITVTKPTPTELTYNKELHSFPITVDPSDATVTYSTGENINYNSEVPSFTDAGEYTVYYRVLKENYTKVYGSFPVKINKATNPTTVSESTSVDSGGKTVDLSANVTRNGATGAVSYTISGEANGCTVDSNGILTSGSTAGSVTVKVTVAEDTNYQALPEKTITVTINEKLTQTITASDVTATYGDTDKSISASVTEPTTGGGAITYAVKDGSGDYIDVAADGKLTIKAVPPTDGKAYVIVTAAETDDYAKATKEVVVTISKATVTVTAKDQSIYVNGTVPDLSAPVLDTHYTVTGLVGEDALTTAPVLAYQKDDSAATPDNTTAGTYDIVASGAAASDNYTITYANGTLTITARNTQTITASDVNATYGDTDKSVSATTDGNGEISYTVKAGSENYIDVNTSTGALTIKAVPADGKAYVTVRATETTTGGTGDKGYAAATKDVTVNISKATVTIAAKNQSIFVGGTVPTLSGTDFYTVTGLVGEETLTTNPTLAYQKDGSAATPDNTTAGTYDIVASGATASDNYTITYANGTLTISDKGTQTITADDVTATYGDTDKSVSAIVTDPATGGGAISYAVNDGSADYIDVNATTGALTIKKVPADGKAYVTVTAAGTAAYEQATKEVTVTINKANAVPATVTANNRTYDGTEKPLVTVDDSMLVGGDMQYALGTATEATEPYTTSIPAKTEVGTYYVWYKVKGNENHNDADPKVVTVKIATPSTYTVTVTNDGHGTGAANPASGVTGTEVTLTNTPAEGYQFKEWQVISGGVTVTDNKFLLGAANVEIKAIFEALPAGVYTITVTDDGHGTGAANPASGVTGTEVTLTNTPAAGYQFKEWQVISGGVTVENNQFTIGTTNVEVKAVFEAQPAGSETGNTQTVSGAPALTASNMAEVVQSVVEAILNRTLENAPANIEELKQALAQPGAEVTLTLVSTPLADGDVPAADKTALNEAVQANGYDGYQPFDLSLLLTVKVPGSDKPVTAYIHASGKEVTFSLQVPENLRKQGRTFYLLHVSGGKVTILDSKTGDTLTGKSQNFSTYAIAYQDAAEPVKSTFYFRKVWEGSTEKSIDFTLYSADGKVIHQGFDKRILNAKEWSYSTVFKDAGSCYIIEKPIPGYITRYVNVGEYAGITDRCCNGGTIINKRIPKTGDETPLLLWAGMLLTGAAGLTVALTVNKRRKAHK